MRTHGYGDEDSGTQGQTSVSPGIPVKKGAPPGTMSPWKPFWDCGLCPRTMGPVGGPPGVVFQGTRTPVPLAPILGPGKAIYDPQCPV
ncbi:unnamed protein product [Gadus morhua 'NCC']